MGELKRTAPNLDLIVFCRVFHISVHIFMSLYSFLESIFCIIVISPSCFRKLMSNKQVCKIISLNVRGLRNIFGTK